jgi:esterase/lipase
MDSNHTPFFLDSPTGNAIVVFIHGFMGSPRQFDSLALSVKQKG